MAKYYKHGDAQYRASEKYRKNNIRRIVVSLNRNTDQDIIDFLDGKDNIQGYIKGIVRTQMRMLDQLEARKRYVEHYEKK